MSFKLLNKNIRIMFLGALGFTMLTGFQNCSIQNGNGRGVSLDGQARKIDMSISSTATEPAPDPVVRSCKDLDLTGTQINAKIFPVRAGSRFLTYSCLVSSFTSRPSLFLDSRLVRFSLYDAAQVNCQMALPDGATLRIHDAAQANVKTVMTGANLEVTNVNQANVTIAIGYGQTYQFDVTALQLNNLSSCSAFRTTDPTAPRIVIHANVQANISCIDIGLVDWENPALKDPDGIPLHADGSSLHIQ